MMTRATPTINGRTGRCLTRMAPMGAAITPPMIRPAAEVMSDHPRVSTKVSATVQGSENGAGSANGNGHTAGGQEGNGHHDAGTSGGTSQEDTAA